MMFRLQGGVTGIQPSSRVCVTARPSPIPKTWAGLDSRNKRGNEGGRVATRALTSTLVGEEEKSWS
jgi:hypothetical protein